MPDRPPFESMTTEQLSEWCSMDANRPGNYPLTLDGANAAMPDGWGFELSRSDQWNTNDGSIRHKVLYQAIGSKSHPTGDGRCIVGEPVKCPVLAMFRLACECRWAERSNP